MTKVDNLMKIKKMNYFPLQFGVRKFVIISQILLAHLSRRLKGELIVYQSSCRLCVCVSVNIFKLEYLKHQWANRNKILSEPPLGWGKGSNRLWARSDWNSGVHGNG